MNTSAEPRSRSWAFLPAACAIHCVLTPIFVAVLPIMQFGEVIEPGLLAVSMVIGAVEARSGLRVHGRWAVGVAVALGASIWSASLLGAFLPSIPEPLSSAVGGLTIAAALFWNGQLRHKRECAEECSCPVPHPKG